MNNDSFQKWWKLSKQRTVNSILDEHGVANRRRRKRASKILGTSYDESRITRQKIHKWLQRVLSREADIMEILPGNLTETGPLLLNGHINSITGIGVSELQDQDALIVASQLGVGDKIRMTEQRFPTTRTGNIPETPNMVMLLTGLGSMSGSQNPENYCVTDGTQLWNILDATGGTSRTFQIADGEFFRDPHGTIDTAGIIRMHLEKQIYRSRYQWAITEIERIHDVIHGITLQVN